MLERFLFAKIEMWVLLLVLLLGTISTTLFGFVVFHTAGGGKKAGIFGEISLGIAKFPGLVKELVLHRDEHVSRERTWPGRAAGFDVRDDTGSRNFILLSRHDGDIGYNVTEFVQEGDATPLASWIFDEPDKYVYEPRSRHTSEVTSDAANMRATHPWLDTDGNLTFHFTRSPIYQLDVCSKVVWMNDDFGYHHSLERDVDGNFWSPGNTHAPLDADGFDDHLVDDHLVKISPDGQTLFSKSVIEILKESDLINRMYVYDAYVKDPIHLNDVQPVFADGPHWKRGDVFLSLGHLNMLMLYRPSENKLVWWSQDQVMHQHDIDVLDEHRIGVYNNNRTTRALGNVVIGYNEELVFDFATGKIASPWADAFRRHEIRTVTQGRVDFGADGSLLVEETDYGRLIKLSASGELEWEYINKSSNGEVHVMNWVRYIDATQGARISEVLSRRKCDE
ncbi:MAG: hypothetical protein ACI9W2_001960 [Gammaproteobacteria bacterium]|jgi:hypothetical protein